MKSDREMLAQALEALNLFNYRGDNDAELFQVGQIIALIKARLSDDDDEPVAWLGEDMDHGCLYYDKQDAIDDGCAFIFPVYRRPHPKALLEDEEILQIGHAAGALEGNNMLPITFARAIEQKIWEKGDE